MSLITTLPPIIAHRGLSSLAPENTYAAIELAAQKGINWIEIDVNISADGIPYLHHDDKLHRCTNGTGYLVRTHSDILDKLDAGSWFSEAFAGEPLMRLEKLFSLIEKYNLGVNLEIKPTYGSELEATNIICDYILDSWPNNAPLLISSFNRIAVQQARTRLPDHNIGMLVVAIPDNWQAILEDMECNSFHCAWEFLTVDNANAIREAGYPILAYTVDDAMAAKSLLEMNVTSVFSNRPDQLVSEMAMT